MWFCFFFLYFDLFILWFVEVKLQQIRCAAEEEQQRAARAVQRCGQSAGEVQRKCVLSTIHFASSSSVVSLSYEFLILHHVWNRLFLGNNDRSPGSAGPERRRNGEELSGVPEAGLQNGGDEGGAQHLASHLLQVQRVHQAAEVSGVPIDRMGGLMGLKCGFGFFLLFFFSVDTYESHESILYCKPHFRALFTPKAVEETDPGEW